MGKRPLYNFKLFFGRRWVLDVKIWRLKSIPSDTVMGMPHSELTTRGSKDAHLPEEEIDSDVNRQLLYRIHIGAVRL